MALKRRDLEQLIARMGRDSVLHGDADRLVYSTDVGSPPGIVDLLTNRKADAVVRCRSIEDVETVVRFCHRRRIPMTPRAAATNALGGAVPKRGGVVIDLTGLNRRVDIDEGRSRVRVDAGVVIEDLRQRLLAVGLDVPCYPTSGMAATIGGFVSMDGHGLGSTENGNIGRYVTGLEGVLPDGQRFTARDAEEIGFYVGLGGSTGIITTIELQLVEASNDAPTMVAVGRWRDAQRLIEEATQRFRLKHVMFRSNDFYKLRAEATGERKTPVGDRHAVFLVFHEPEHGKHQEALQRMAERHGGDVLAQKTADLEWAQRFFPIKAKVLGPSLVAGETFVPVAKMTEYLRQLRNRVVAPELSVEGHLTDDGRIYFFIYALDDERRPQYPLGWGTSAWILKLAKDLGGRSYHSGVWLQWESKAVFGATRYKKLKAFKKQGDHRNLMNPGMVFPLPAPVPEFVHKLPVMGPIPAPSLGFQLWAGNPMLQMAGGMAKHRRRKTLGVRAADIAADMARGGDLARHSDIIWGADVPTLQAIPNPGDLPMTHTPRGKIVLAKEFVRGRITDPWDLKAALDVAEPSDEDAAVCWQWEDVKATIEAFRRVVEAEGVELEVKAPEIEEEVVEVAATEAKPKGEGKDYDAIRKQAAETPEEEKAWVLAADCIVCNGCESACPTDAAIVTDMARVDRDLCIADGACFDACPTDAIRPGIEDREASAGWPEGSRLAGQFGV